MSKDQQAAVEFLRRQQEDWRKGWLLGAGMGLDPGSVQHSKNAIYHLQTAIDALERD